MKNISNILALLLTFTFSLLSSCTSEKNEWSISSPAGNIRFKLKAGDQKQLLYDVTVADTMGVTSLMKDSPLGIKRSDQEFITDLKMMRENPIESINESFNLVTGKCRRVESASNQQSIVFKNKNGSELELVIRVFDDGVAFRYRFPGNDSLKYSVEDELTGFSFASEGKAWMQTYDKVTQWSPAYETYYKNGIPLGTDAPSVEGWSFPALFKTDKTWILLTEAAVDSTWFGAHLNQKCAGKTYTIRMAEADEANGVVPQKPSSSLPWTSPWRAIIIGRELSGIVESNMIEMLNPPSMINDISWIKPGRASWSWWSDGSSPKSFSALKKFVDMSAELGWEYSLVDANWDLMKGGTINDLIKYAEKKKVGLLMWYNSGGVHNSVTECPRDIMSDPVKRREEFKKLATWGVKGVKVDFFQSDKPEIIKQYFDILRDAADNNIMVNFHGCTLPRGWKRTWPNLVSMEAVRGAECYGFDSLFTSMAPQHNTILPFTRNVVGSMDYTPVTLSDQRFPHITTYAHELALAIVFESGILHFADKPEMYLTLSAVPKEFISKVPVVWDKTLLLAGEPGEYCVIARENEGVWYIGAINGTAKPLSLDIPLGRLDNVDLEGYIITDSIIIRSLISGRTEIGSSGRLKAELQPYGGMVAMLTKGGHTVKTGRRTM